MHFNVSQLLNESSGSSRRFEVSERIARGVTTEKLALQGVVILLRTDRGIWVSGDLESNPSCDCSRCLREFDEKIEISVEEEFFPTIDPMVLTFGYETQIVEGKFWIGNDHILDLDKLVMESLEMNIPMKPMCKVDCSGLCPMCGVDLNHFKCECENEPRDARWGALLGKHYSPKVNVS
ncbi:MAG: DUF177 domain-containing protein [SAR202 cluster bacterium]|nr:DUF177 domain-containing protein [SAR202 cluster bacterium]